MKKIARMLRTHCPLILNYFRARKQFSSGVAEGLNNKAKLTMRKSYGFRTFHITEIALYHALGKLPGKRCKSPGDGAFFSCADSASWILCTMCRRHSPFPR